MNYAGIKDKDVANGKGFGVSLFVSGCTHHCKGCFNSETWDFNYGNEFTKDTIKEILNLLNRPYVDYFAILGGEPFEEQNHITVLNLLYDIREKFPDITINIWSGYLFDELVKDDINKLILSLCDYLIDGEFKEELKDLHLVMRGSSNQRVIDLNKTFDKRGIVLADDV